MSSDDIDDFDSASSEDDADEVAFELLSSVREGLRKREVLESGSVPLEDCPWLSKDLRYDPWMGNPPVLSYVRVLRRDVDGNPYEIRESLAPGGLISSEALADCDDESLFDALAALEGRVAKAHTSEERIWVCTPSAKTRMQLEIDSETRCVVLHREYRNISGDFLLEQTISTDLDAMYTFHRNLWWEREFRPDYSPCEPYGEELYE